MPNNEECQSLDDIKVRQDKLDTRLNEHSERIVRVESKVDIALAQIEEVKKETKQTQSLVGEVKNIAQSALNIVEVLKKPNDNLEKSELRINVLEKAQAKFNGALIVLSGIWTIASAMLIFWLTNNFIK